MILTVPFAGASSPEKPFGCTTVRAVFEKLECIKNKKKDQILSLLKRAEIKAQGASEDKTMLKFFHVMNRDKCLLNDKSLPRKLKKAIAKYQRTIDEYYLNRYLEFYDILFIDNMGFVFYSIRKESDYRANILSGSLGKTDLARCLRSEEHEFFIDFQHYSPAGEPAAFFLVRVCKNSVHQGWIVFQYPLNMLNALLVDYDELGETGEVYIVNQNHFMLTQSRFKGENSSMNVHVDTEAVQCAMREQSGRKIIKGYRGKRVFVVFERFSFWDTSWIIIASIEEAEVLTNYYRANKNICRQRILDALRNAPVTPTGINFNYEQCARKVDMDEFAKAEERKSVGTRGVSSCTAVTAAIPDSFGYLAHISTHDKIYDNLNPLNTLKDMVRRITHYDIHLHELHELQFVIVANHSESFSTAVNKLLKYGIMITQIKFAFNPEAEYANVICNPERNKTIIEWVYSSYRKTVRQDDSSILSLGNLLKTKHFWEKGFCAD